MKFLLMVGVFLLSGCIHPTGIERRAISYENQYRRDWAKKMGCSDHEIQEQLKPLTYELVETRLAPEDIRMESMTAVMAQSFRDDLLLLPCASYTK